MVLSKMNAKVALWETQFLVAANSGWVQDDEKYQQLYANGLLNQQSEEAMKIERQPGEMVGVGHWKTIPQDSTDRRGLLGCTFILPERDYVGLGAHPAFFRAAAGQAFQMWETELKAKFAARRASLGVPERARLELPGLSAATPLNWSDLAEKTSGGYLSISFGSGKLDLEVWATLLALLSEVLDGAGAGHGAKRCLVLAGIKERADRNIMVNSLLWMLPLTLRKQATAITWLPKEATVDSVQERYTLVVQPWPAAYKTVESDVSISLNMPQLTTGNLDPHDVWREHGPWEQVLSSARKTVETFNSSGPEGLRRRVDKILPPPEPKIVVVPQRPAPAPPPVASGRTEVPQPARPGIPGPVSFPEILAMLQEHPTYEFDEPVQRRFVAELLAKSRDERRNILEQHMKARREWLPHVAQWAKKGGPQTEDKFAEWLLADLQNAWQHRTMNEEAASYFFRLLVALKRVSPANINLAKALAESGHEICDHYFDVPFYKPPSQK